MVFFSCGRIEKFSVRPGFLSAEQLSSAIFCWGALRRKVVWRWSWLRAVGFEKDSFLGGSAWMN